MANDLSIRAVLTCQTQAFDGGMKRAARSAQEFSRTTRREFSLVEMAANKSFLAIAKKATGAIAIAGSLAGEMAGASSGLGRFLQGAGNVAGGAAAGSFVGGPWGAAIGGGLAAMKEFRDAVSDSAKATRELQEAQAKARDDVRKASQKVIDDLRAETSAARRQFTAVFRPPQGIVPRPGLTAAEETAFRANRIALENQRAEGIKRFQFLAFGRHAVPKPASEIKAADDLVKETNRLMDALDDQVIARQAGRGAAALGRRAVGIAGDVGLGFFNAARIFNPGVFLPPELRHAIGAGFMAQFMFPQMQAAQSMFAPGMGAPGFAMRGTNEYFQQIHDNPQGKVLEKSLKAEEKQVTLLERLPDNVARAINAGRVTIEM